jgi:hypothetical protein
MKSVPKKPTATESSAKQLDGFIAKFEPAMGMLIRQYRAELRRYLPTGVEIVQWLS